MNEEKKPTANQNNNIGQNNPSEPSSSVSPSFSNVAENITDAVNSGPKSTTFSNNYRVRSHNTSSFDDLDNPNQEQSKTKTSNKVVNKAIDTGALFNPTIKALKIARDLNNKNANDSSNLNNIKAKRLPQPLLPNKNESPLLNKNKETLTDDSNQDDNEEDNIDDNDNDTDSNNKENKGSTIGSILNPLSGVGIKNPSGFLSRRINISGLISIKVGTLIAIGSVIASFIIILFPALFIINILSEFNPLMSLEDVLSGETIASSTGGEKFYENLLKIQEEYNAKNQTLSEFSLQVITSTFHILQSRDKSFGYDDMTLNKMREVADLLFDSVETEDGETYVLSDEAGTKRKLAKFFADNLKEEDEATCNHLAEEVYDYIEAYLDLITKKNKSSSSGGDICTYNVNGQEITDLKVRLMQAGDVGGLGHCGGTYGLPMEGEELVDFEKYILGVAYAEIGGDASEHAFKSQLIMARTYALNRPRSMGGAHSVKYVQEDGQWILQITNCVSDQVYCDPDKGCSKDVPSSNQFGMMYSGTSHPYVYKEAIPADSQLRQWASEVAGKVMVDSSGNLLSGDYVNTTQNTVSSLAAAGYDYTDILVNVYGSGLEIQDSNCTSSSASGNYSNWKQYDTKWASTKIANSNSTLGDIGCLTTSIAMLVAKSNVLDTTLGAKIKSDELNPGTFAEALNKNGGYSSGGNLNWSAVTNIIPAFKFQGKTSLKGMSKAQKTTTIASKITQKQYCTAEVKGDSGQHWVAIDKVENNKVYMFDPGSNATDMFSEYGWKNISELGCYQIGS